MEPRPSDVLTADEGDRADDFIELYNDVLAGLSAAPTALDEFFAHEIAASLWRVRRAGCDTETVMQQVILKRVRSEAQANAMALTDNQTRQRAAHIKDMQLMLDTRKKLNQELERSLGLKVLSGGKAR